MPPEANIEKIARGWEVAMSYARERFIRVTGMEADELEGAEKEGLLVLETLCLFVHSSVKHGQYRIPPEFWKILHVEYGIVVYPSALVEDIKIRGMDNDRTFAEAYSGHIVMHQRCCGPDPPRCPMEYLQEPPPAYER